MSPPRLAIIKSAINKKDNAKKLTSKDDNKIGALRNKHNHNKNGNNDKNDINKGDKGKACRSDMLLN